MATFMTLCEAYIGIEPYFNMWNYIFHARLRQGLGTEVMTLGSVDIFIRFGCGVDPYFHLPMSGSSEWVRESMALSKERHRCTTP
jgi:hypothetical protein